MSLCETYSQIYSSLSVDTGERVEGNKSRGFLFKKMIVRVNLYHTFPIKKESNYVWIYKNLGTIHILFIFKIR